MNPILYALGDLINAVPSGKRLEHHGLPLDILVDQMRFKKSRTVIDGIRTPFPRTDKEIAELHLPFSRDVRDADIEAERAQRTIEGWAQGKKDPIQEYWEGYNNQSNSMRSNNAKQQHDKTNAEGKKKRIEMLPRLFDYLEEVKAAILNNHGVTGYNRTIVVRRSESPQGLPPPIHGLNSILAGREKRKLDLKELYKQALPSYSRHVHRRMSGL